MKTFSNLQKEGINILRSKNLFKKVCRTCKQEFYTDMETAKVCPKCKKKTKIRKREKQRQEFKSTKPKKYKPKKLDLPLHKVMDLLVKYNTEHGTNYTYGQFVQELNNGSIKLEG